jgi:ADP-heptose:LPS heptosyltransferase
MHKKTIAALILAATLAGCDAVTVVTDGFKHASAVATDLEKATGIKPEVGFSWKNSRLTSVTVSFPKLYEDKPLRELATLTRAVVAREFGQTPKTIQLSFDLDAGTIAQAEPSHSAN